MSVGMFPRKITLKFSDGWDCEEGDRATQNPGAAIWAVVRTVGAGCHLVDNSSLGLVGLGMFQFYCLGWLRKID